MLASTSLPAAPSSPGVARAWAMRLCEGEGLEELSDAVAVIVSELVTNAVVHARSEVVVTLSTTGHDAAASLRIAVTDSDSRLPRFECVDEDALGGRGLRLVQELSVGYGVDVEDFTKTVWAEVAIKTAPALTVTINGPEEFAGPIEPAAPAPRVPVA